MMSAYDRSAWPDAERNPLVQLLRREDEWFSNAEILEALGYGGTKRSLISQWPTLASQLGDDDTVVESRGVMFVDNKPQGRTGGLERKYSRKALVLIAMRAQTTNAAAFRDWVAARVADREDA